MSVKLSEWQDGVPPCDGVWEIRVPEQDFSNHEQTYYARFKDGKWASGFRDPFDAGTAAYNGGVFEPYASNNNPANPRKWRGVIEE